MATSNMKASIPCDIHSLWKVITEIENFTKNMDKASQLSSYMEIPLLLKCPNCLYRCMQKILDVF